MSKPLFLIRLCSRNFSKSGYWALRISLFLAAVIAAPVAEELVFRGYLYSVVKRFLGGIPALVLSGIVFAVIHANIPRLPLFLFACCCLTLAYETTGSLWVSMTMHAAFNAVNFGDQLIPISVGMKGGRAVVGRD